MRMRMLGGAMVALGMAAGLRAETVATGPATAAAPKVPTVTIEISGRAIEKPVLEFSLMYRAEEMTKGNAALKYLVAADYLQQYPKLTMDDQEALEKFRNEPLGELDEAAATKYILVQSAMQLGGPFKWAREGAKLESYDPETEVRTQGYRALLPSLSKYRQIAYILAIAIRLDIKHHRWAEAREKLAVGYGMARHLGGTETVIESLVGAAIATSMNKCLADWASEGGPNLYWELVNMPRPFVDMQRALWCERAEAVFSFPEFKEMKEGHYSADEWAAIVRDCRVPLMDSFGPEESQLPPMLRGWRLKVTGALFGAAEYPKAKDFLVARGMARGDVEKMSVPEALGRYFVRSYDEVADEMFKGYGLPVYEGVKIATEAEKEVQKPFGDVNILARLFLPSLSRAGVLAARADRDLDMMRVMEGIRAYAAEKGKLPEKLEEVGLPMPVDVMTGKMFEYTREGEEARIVSPAPGRNPRDGAVIVVKLKK